MNKYLIILLLIISQNMHGSFSKSKKVLLNKIYFDNKKTFYCMNPYEIINKKAYIIDDTNFYQPRNKYYKSGKINTRAKRVEWEHIMPAYNFGRFLKCWQDGGRKACRNDKTFNLMESDMHNLVPAIGEINGDRSNYRFAHNKPTLGQYGKCNFEVDFKNRRVFVDNNLKGDIARIYLYMSAKYHIKLSNQEQKLMEAWDKMDPVDEWERIKNKRIMEIQGNENRFIK